MREREREKERERERENVFTLMINNLDLGLDAWNRERREIANLLLAATNITSCKKTIKECLHIKDKDRLAFCLL